MEKKKKAAAAGARIDTAEISQKWDVKEIPEDIKEGVEKIEELLKGASAAKDAMEKKKKAAAAGTRIDTAEISQKWGQDRIDTAEISQKWDVKEIPEDIKEGVEKIEELLKGASAAKD